MLGAPALNAYRAGVFGEAEAVQLTVEELPADERAASWAAWPGARRPCGKVVARPVVIDAPAA